MRDSAMKKSLIIVRTQITMSGKTFAVLLDEYPHKYASPKKKGWESVAEDEVLSSKNVDNSSAVDTLS